MENQLNLFDTSNEATNPACFLGAVGSGVSLNEYKRQLRSEQLHYPALKFQKIQEDYIEHYWRLGMSPTEACNDILTAV